MKISKHLLKISLIAGLCSGSFAVAQEAEDDSAAFQAGQEQLGAALGLAAPEGTVTTRADGTTSAVLGLSGMKMLMVRQNSDGSISYGHAANAAQADAFLQSKQNPAAEE